MSRSRLFFLLLLSPYLVGLTAGLVLLANEEQRKRAFPVLQLPHYQLFSLPSEASGLTSPSQAPIESELNFPPVESLQGRRQGRRQERQLYLLSCNTACQWYQYNFSEGRWDVVNSLTLEDSVQIASLVDFFKSTDSAFLLIIIDSEIDGEVNNTTDKAQVDRLAWLKFIFNSLLFYTVFIIGREMYRFRKQKEQDSKVTNLWEKVNWLVDHKIPNIVNKITILSSDDLVKARALMLPLLRKETEQLQRVISSLRLYNSLLGTERLKNIYPVKLKPIVSQIVASQTTSFRQNTHSVIIRDLPTVLGDKALLYRLFAIVIDNAVRYSGASDPSVVLIEGKTVRDGFCQIKIKDTGEGIPSSQTKVLGHRCLNLSPRSGVGMGWVIAKAIIELHEGRYKIHSHLGRETTVIIILKEASDYSYDSIKGKHQKAQAS